MKSFPGVLLLLAINASAQPALIADFEGSSYDKWIAVGDAFGDKPARGALPGQMPVSGFLGKGLVNSFTGGDKSTGTLTSAEIKLEKPYINYLIGGGNHSNQTCINLLIDSRVARTTTGPDSEHLDWATWDIREFKGKTARIEIVDSHTGGWGHINIDQIEQSDTAREVQVSTDHLYDETWRPQFHFTARSNWLNDPNGLVFYKGEYHLFFQHNPLGINWGNMTWGHAVSTDLVHWRQLPNALERDPMGTMFSGSAVVDWRDTAGLQNGPEKTLVTIYTAAGGTSPESKGKRFTQCIAFSNDRGNTWQKFSGNPVLNHIAAENRDPKVVWLEPSSKWIMTLYLEGNRFAFFSSPDLKSWTHLQDINVPGCDECPDFFEMPVSAERQKRWVWTAANGNYLIGQFDGQRFTPESGPHRADWGKNFYAVQTYSDIPKTDGRRIQVAWMRGGNYPRMPFNQQMSFPCELSVRRAPEGLRLLRSPVREISVLHTNTQEWIDVTLEPGKSLIAASGGDLFDIRAEIELRQASRVTLKLRGEVVEYSVTDRRLTCLGQSAPLDPLKETIQLQALLDRTSIEVFANGGRVSMSSCFLPRQTNNPVELAVSGGRAKLRSLVVHRLKSAWQD